MCVRVYAIGFRLPSPRDLTRYIYISSKIVRDGKFNAYWQLVLCCFMVVVLWVAIWRCVRPNKSNLAFFEGVCLWNFWFGIFAFLGEFGLILIFWLFFGLFCTKLRIIYHRSDRMCAYAHLPLPYAHILTNGYLLNCQSQCPVTWRDVVNTSAAYMVCYWSIKW